LGPLLDIERLGAAATNNPVQCGLFLALYRIAFWVFRVFWIYLSVLALSLVGLVQVEVSQHPGGIAERGFARRLE
jgi:hypothetical protein